MCDEALELFHSMPKKGTKRNVATYNAAISANKKAGNAKGALQLLASMKKEGLKPVRITYNAAIGACANGAEWEVARRLFQVMGQDGYSADYATINSLLPTGEAVANVADAADIFGTALRSSLYGSFLAGPDHPDGGFQLGLHKFACGTARLATWLWLGALLQHVERGGTLPKQIDVITGQGKHRATWTTTAPLKEDISPWLASLGLEETVSDTVSDNPGRLVYDRGEIEQFLLANSENLLSPLPPPGSK